MAGDDEPIELEGFDSSASEPEPEAEPIGLVPMEASGEPAPLPLDLDDDDGADFGNGQQPDLSPVPQAEAASLDLDLGDDLFPGDEAESAPPPDTRQAAVAASAGAVGAAAGAAALASANRASGSSRTTSQAGPEKPAAPKPEPIFYEIDSLYISFKEYLWGENIFASALQGFIYIFLVIFRLRLNASTDDPPIQTYAAFQVDELPQDVAQDFMKPMQELRDLKFDFPVFHRIVDPLHATVYTSATFVHLSGRAVARVFERTSYEKPGGSRRVFVQVFSQLSDGTIALTTSAKRDLLWPTSIHMNRLIGKSPKELWESHQSFLPTLGKNVRPTKTPQDAMKVVDAMHAALREFHIDRGVFRPLDDHDQQVYKTVKTSYLVMSDQPYFNQAVYAEANKSAVTREQSKVGSFVRLLITIGLFVVVARLANTWSFVLQLVIVLLIHEAGHYLCMKYFGYKDLKMFFIPLFGAAVTGRPDRVPGWKQVVTYLAGPVPGILLAIPLAWAGVAFEVKWLVDISLLMLFLNAFNLLPILPMDGGHVLNQTIFCRHPLLEAGVKALTGGLLLLLGILGGGYLLNSIGIALLISVPMTYKAGQFVRSMRDRLPDDEGFPGLYVGPITGRSILEHITEAKPSGQTRTTMGAHVLSVFQQLTSRPPGWLASFGFLFAHLAVFVIAIVVGVMTVVAAVPKGLVGFHMPGAKGTMKVSPVQTVNVAQHPPEVKTNPKYGKGLLFYDMFVVHNDSQEKAIELMDKVKPELKENMAALRIGKTVVFGPESIEESGDGLVSWGETFMKKHKIPEASIMVARPGLKVTAMAPDPSRAGMIAGQLNEFGKTPYEDQPWLMPVWGPKDENISPIMRRKRDRQRETFAKLKAESVNTLRNAHSNSGQHFRNLSDLTEENLNRMAENIAKSTDSAYVQAANTVAQQPGVDEDMIQAFIKDANNRANLRKNQDPNIDPDDEEFSLSSAEWPSCYALLGAAPADYHAASFAVSATSHEGKLTVWITFKDPIRGPPIFLDWLQKQGFDDLQISFVNSAMIESGKGDIDAHIKAMQNMGEDGEAGLPKSRFDPNDPGDED